MGEGVVAALLAGAVLAVAAVREYVRWRGRRWRGTPTDDA